jgi:hypothetical protein
MPKSRARCSRLPFGDAIIRRPAPVLHCTVTSAELVYSCYIGLDARCHHMYSWVGQYPGQVMIRTGRQSRLNGRCTTTLCQFSFDSLLRYKA